MEMHQIRYFLAACDTLNLTRAAEASNVSQPALTKALKLLEDELGGELFDRSARPLRLTELGQRLRGRFQALADMANDISAHARLFNSLAEATYTLGVVSTIGDGPFDAIVQNIKRRVPGVSLSLRLIPQDALIAELRDGALELAIIAPNASCAEGLKLHGLYKEPYFLATPTDHALAGLEQVRLEDLRDIDYVFRTHCELNRRFAGLLAENGIALNNRLSTDQDAIARRMIEQGLGVSMMPAALCRGRLARLPIVDAPLSRSITLAQLPDRALSHAAMTIKEILTATAVESWRDAVGENAASNEC